MTSRTSQNLRSRVQDHTACYGPARPPARRSWRLQIWPFRKYPVKAAIGLCMWSDGGLDGRVPSFEFATYSSAGSITRVRPDIMISSGTFRPRNCGHGYGPCRRRPVPVRLRSGHPGGLGHCISAEYGHRRDCPGNVFRRQVALRQPSRLVSRIVLDPGTKLRKDYAPYALAMHATSGA